MRRFILLVAQFLFLWADLPCRAAPHFEEEATTTTLENFDLDEWVRARAFSALEKKLALLDADPSRDEYQKRPIYRAYEECSEYPSDLDEQTEEWCTAFPNSYYAWATRGAFLIAYAWEARGSDWGHKVKEENWQVFRKRLQHAQEALLKACEINSHDPFARAELIIVAKGLNFPREKAEEYFKAAVTADPTYYPSYFNYLEFLKPKWHGSEKEMLDFARECAARPPEKSRVQFILLDAHREMTALYYEGTKHWNKPEVFADVERVFQQELKWRSNSLVHNQYAWYAAQCDKADVSQRELNIVGLDWIPKVWVSFDKFLAARTQAFPEYNGQKGLNGQCMWVLDRTSEALQKFPTKAALYELRALARQEQKIYDLSEKEMQRALELDPNSSQYYEELGKIEDSSQQPDKALSAYQAAMRLKPHEPLNYWRVTSTMINLNRWKDALPAAQKNLSFYPGAVWSKYWLILAQARNGQTSAALQLANQALTLLPEQIKPVDLKLLPDEARSQITEECQYLEARGYANYFAGNYQDARRDCETARAKLPYPANSVLILTCIYLNPDGTNFFPKQGLTWAENLMKYQIYHPAEHYCILGIAHELNGDLAAARKAYQQGLEIDATDSSCSRRLQALPRN